MMQQLQLLGTQRIQLRLADSLVLLKTFEAESFGSVVSDPPYGLSFMNRAWDSPWNEVKGDEDLVGLSPEARSRRLFQEWCYLWLKECYRILEPEGVIKLFNAPRMYHRMAMAMELAGFEEPRMEGWIYSSGFPKSLNVGKAIDKQKGKFKDRKVVGVATHLHSRGKNNGYPKGSSHAQAEIGNIFTEGDAPMITAPATPEAALWEAYGTSLKPAQEPILIARKPL